MVGVAERGAGQASPFGRDASGEEKQVQGAESARMYAIVFAQEGKSSYEHSQCCGCTHEQWEKAYRSDGASRSQSRSAKEVKVSFGRADECCEYARTVGDNEVVGPVPLSRLGGSGCHGGVRGPVRGLSGSRTKGGLSPCPDEHVSVLETCSVTASTMFQLERSVLADSRRSGRVYTWRKWHARFQQSIKPPREYGRVSREPVALGRRSDAACLSKAPSGT